ncbi:MAG TPA: alpha/beta fold hydrolase [Vicinamibacteria bacterium]|nr:alpha/beta fold hydrolase [Vicinamibacteria bacterium]
MTAFLPSPLAAGGHRQTLLGYWRRRSLEWRHVAEDIVVTAQDGVNLLLRASWQPGPRAQRPALVLLHGLGASDAAKYVVAAGQLAFARGWHVVRMNLRGAGDGVRHAPVLYNAGLDGDLAAVLEAVARQAPRVGVLGFSLGGNLALLLLGRRADRLPPRFVGAVGVSPPLDLAACATALERPGNRLYQLYFMRNLRRAYRERQGARPDVFAPGLEQGVRTVREYDERITAPYGGYPSASDYYASSSAGPRLGAVRHPALVLAAWDDPLIPGESVARWPVSGSVTREMLPTGGHVGFVAPSDAPGGFWAAERALDFLGEG